MDIQDVFEKDIFRKVFFRDGRGDPFFLWCGAGRGKDENLRGGAGPGRGKKARKLTDPKKIDKSM